MRQKVAIAVIGVILGLAAWGSPADATLRLRIEDLSTGVGAVVTDGGAGDGSSLAGVIQFSGTVGFSLINVTTGISKPQLGGINNVGEIDLNSVNIVTPSGSGTLRITLEDDSYTGAPLSTLHVLGLVGGTLNAGAGSTITVQSWANGDNLVPILGADQAVGVIGAIGATPAGSVAAWGPAFQAGNGAFSSSSSAPFDNGAVDTFSLFAQVSIAFTGPGSVSFDENQSAVPEPASLLLLGTGLAGLSLLGRRKKHNSQA